MGSLHNLFDFFFILFRQYKHMNERMNLILRQKKIQKPQKSFNKILSYTAAPIWIMVHHNGERQLLITSERTRSQRT